MDGLIVAIVAGLLMVPCSYRGRRKELRLRSRRGALERAMVDGYQAWMVLFATMVGIWMLHRYSLSGIGGWIVAMAFFAWLPERRPPWRGARCTR